VACKAKPELLIVIGQNSPKRFKMGAIFIYLLEMKTKETHCICLNIKLIQEHVMGHNSEIVLNVDTHSLPLI
jgi:hypothetical protein